MVNYVVCLTLFPNFKVFVLSYFFFTSHAQLSLSCISLANPMYSLWADIPFFFSFSSKTSPVPNAIYTVPFTYQAKCCWMTWRRAAKPVPWGGTPASSSSPSTNQIYYIWSCRHIYIPAKLRVPRRRLGHFYRAHCICWQCYWLSPRYKARYKASHILF